MPSNESLSERAASLPQRQEVIVEVPTISQIRAAEQEHVEVVLASADGPTEEAHIEVSPEIEPELEQSPQRQILENSAEDASHDADSASASTGEDSSVAVNSGGEGPESDALEQDSEDEESSFAMSSSSAASTPVKRPVRRKTASMGPRKSQSAPRQSVTPAKVKVPVATKTKSSVESVKRKSTKAPMRTSITQPKTKEPLSEDGGMDADMIPDKAAREADLPNGTRFVPSPEDTDAGVKKKKRSVPFFGSQKTLINRSY